jgi:hypothetical protein
MRPSLPFSSFPFASDWWDEPSSKALSSTRFRAFGWFRRGDVWFAVDRHADGWGEHARQIPKHRAHDVTDSDARQ